MKHKFEYAAVDAEGIEQLAFTLNASQGQAERVFYAMAYAMATDGGWRYLALYLVNKGGSPSAAQRGRVQGGQMMKREKVGPMAEQQDFLSVDALGNIAVKAEYRVNKKERPSIRTRTER